MFCEACGKQIPDNSKFCDGCGTPVKPVEAPEPSYGKSLYEEQGFGGGVQDRMPYGDPGYGRPYGDPARPSGGAPGYGRPQGMDGPAPYGRPDHRQSRKDPGPQPGRMPEEYPDRPEKKKKGGGQTALIVALSVVAAALIVVLVILGFRTFGGKKDGGGEGRVTAVESGETGENVSAEEASQGVPETGIPETTLQETEIPAPETTAPAAPETTVPPSTEAVSEYILPTSNSAYLTEADLAPLTKEQLRLARNEIYARHGRKFKDASLNEYFLGKSWYVPLIEPDHFNENVFNDYETANRKLIADYEKKMGY